MHYRDLLYTKKKKKKVKLGNASLEIVRRLVAFSFLRFYLRSLRGVWFIFLSTLSRSRCNVSGTKRCKFDVSGIKRRKFDVSGIML